MYTVCGEISCWINHSMYSCLWNPFHVPEGFLTEATLTFHRPSLACLLSATLSPGNVHKYRFLIHTVCSQAPGGSMGWWAAILGTLLGFVSQQEPQPSTRRRLCFGNRVSPWRGMNAQMCHRWDSLNWDLAHWYSLWTITMLQNQGAEKC